MQKLKGKRILLVEDDALVLLLLGDMVAEFGCRVAATASNVEDGVAKATLLDCDMALLDLDLHGRRCYPIADTLLRRGVPFAFVTGYDENTVPKRFAAIPIISKPFGGETVARTLKTL